MRTAIMTWHHYNNYGTALQLCAMLSVLRRRGHDVRIIDYIPDGKVFDLPSEALILKFMRLTKGHFNDKNIVGIINGESFDEFRNKYFSYTERCETQTDLENLNGSFDAFICGSDQIWSPVVFDKHYFLDFVSDRTKILAYAPSFGIERIDNKDIKSQIEKLTKRFEHLSVREESGKVILSEFGENPHVVADPTLLLSSNEWDFFSSSSNYSEEYLLVYFLRYNIKHLSQAYNIAHKLNLKVKIIPVNQQDLENPDCIKTKVGPAEFISLIKNAAYVCTDSFHGTVFSVLYNKEFYTFERFSKNELGNQNTRIYSILEKLQLTNRIFRQNSKPDFVNRIDYGRVNQLVEELRERSLEYLTSSMESIGDSIESKINKQKFHILEKHSLCCGCGACASVCPANAISIGRNTNGFFRACVDEASCIHCGICNEVCPFQGSNYSKDLFEASLYSYKDHEKDVLLHTSSGGLGYRLGTYFHDQGYAVVGCKYDIENQMARHDIVYPHDNIEKLKEFNGSKYLQSEFASALKEVMSIELPIAIFGTPCQIAGARKLLKNKSNIIYVDLICHGIPSYESYRKYLKYLSHNKGFDVENLSINFRYKKKGWHTKYQRISGDKKTLIMSEKHDPYMRIFNHSICYGKCCYECRWRLSSAADIRLGDYWGRRFRKDETGVSMTVAVTDVGCCVLRKAGINGNLIRESFDDYLNSQLTRNIHQPIFWEQVIEMLKDEESTIEEVVKNYVKPFERRERVVGVFNGIWQLLKK